MATKRKRAKTPSLKPYGKGGKGSTKKADLDKLTPAQRRVRRAHTHIPDTTVYRNDDSKVAKRASKKEADKVGRGGAKAAKKFIAKGGKKTTKADDKANRETYTRREKHRSDTVTKRRKKAVATNKRIRSQKKTSSYSRKKVKKV